MRAPNFLASGSLDRLGHRRLDENWLATTRSSAGTRLTLVWRSHNLVRHGEGLEAGHLPAVEWLERLLEDEGKLVFLGTRADHPFFALDVSHLEDPLGELDLEEALGFEDLRRVGSVLDRDDGALLAYARAMMTWHHRHRFCGRCGSLTQSAQGGHLRRCSDGACGAEIFPRIDPAVIMLAHDEEACLLGRQKSWPAGVFSTLAGFVEPGESLEDAVRREVREETGIEVVSSRYHSSQPWPFPSSLMLGFYAEARRAEPRTDGLELDEARWLSRRQILEREVRLPPPMSIARRLIDDWLRDAP